MRVSGGQLRWGPPPSPGPADGAHTAFAGPPTGQQYRRTEDPGAGSLMVCDLPSTLASVLTAKCFASKLPERAIPEGGRGL